MKLLDFTLRMTIPQVPNMIELVQSYLNDFDPKIIHIAYDADSTKYVKQKKTKIPNPHYHILIQLSKTIDTLKLIKYFRSHFTIPKGNKGYSISPIKDLEKALIYNHKTHHIKVYAFGITAEMAIHYEELSYDKNDEKQTFKILWQQFLDNYPFETQSKTIKQNKTENYFKQLSHNTDETQNYLEENTNYWKISPYQFYQDCFNFLGKNNKRMSHFIKNDIVQTAYKNNLLDTNDLIKYYHLPM